MTRTLSMPAAARSTLLLLVALSTPVLGQGGGIAGAIPQQVTVDSLYRDSNAPAVLVAAHRGNSGAWLPRYWAQFANTKRGKRERAENSLAAVDAAIAAGAHVIELDVRHTQDDRLVLIHDSTIDRTTRQKGKVKDFTLAQLRVIELVPEGQIPTLAEAIQLTRGRVVLNLHLKTDRIDLVVAEIQALHAHDNVILFAGRKSVLRRAKQLDARVEVMPRSKSASDVVALLNEFHPPAIHLDSPEDLTPAVLSAAAAAGARLWVNALGPRDAFGAGYRKLIKDGAGVIQTERPRCVARAIAKVRNP